MLYFCFFQTHRGVYISLGKMRRPAFDDSPRRVPSFFEVLDARKTFEFKYVVSYALRSSSTFERLHRLSYKSSDDRYDTVFEH